jgi:putative transposase
MARSLRLEFAGALYHVTSRGDRQENIFETDEDRHQFLTLLGDVCSHHNWQCHAYCLMSNHYHLLVETPDGNLSRGMRQLNGVYSQSFNRAHKRVGHVFQGRYKAILVEKESYLLELARYIVLNPVRAKMVLDPIEWPWSSYRAMTQKQTKIDWLFTDWILSVFGKRRSQSIIAYKRFVSQGKGLPSPWTYLKNSMVLGSEQFLDEVQIMIDDLEELDEVPRKQRRAPALPLREIEAQSNSRDDAILKMYKTQHYTLKQIGDYFGLHYSRISRIVAKGKTRPL